MKSKNTLPKSPAEPAFLENEPQVVVRIGVIGCGYWGPNLIRTFHELPQSKVVAVSDIDLDRLQKIHHKFPAIKITTNSHDILNDPAVDAVIIATPISTHYNLARQALKRSKHVFVEKPLTATVREAMALTALAEKVGKILMVGHTFIYNPAVIKITEVLKKDELGEIYYIDSVRVNLGLYQSDGRNVIWDLAPHDISIVLHWTKQVPTRVSAWGQSFVKAGVEDVAFVRLEFPGRLLAHLHVSWLAPSKIRRMTVVGNKKMAVFDDLGGAEKIKIADHGAHLNPTELRVGYRVGDIVSPRVDVTEPLFQECSHFVDCILRDATPITDGQSGVNVVRVLEAADRSIKRGGAAIAL